MPVPHKSVTKFDGAIDAVVFVLACISALLLAYCWFSNYRQRRKRQMLQDAKSEADRRIRSTVHQTKQIIFTPDSQNYQVVFTLDKQNYARLEEIKTAGHFNTFADVVCHAVIIFKALQTHAQQGYTDVLVRNPVTERRRRLGVNLASKEATKAKPDCQDCRHFAQCSVDNVQSCPLLEESTQ